MSAPGSPTHARRESPIVHQNHRVEYTSSYSDHFNGMARPSSAPPSTTPRRQLQYDSPLKNTSNNNNNNNNNNNSYNTNNNNYNRTSSYNSSNNGGTLLAPMPLDSSLSPSTPRRHSSSLFPAQSTANYNNTTPNTNYNNNSNNNNSSYNSTSYSSTYNSSLSPTSPSSPRYDEVSGAATSRYAKYNWNKIRNPLVDGDEQKSPSGRKHVPSYFENLEKFDEDTKRLARKSRPEPTPFMIDPTRAGIPTLIQKIRTHEEDIYYQKRPSTAPESPMTREDIPAAGASPKQYSRRPCQIEKFNTRRNPLIESGDVEPIRRQIIGFNKESEAEVQFARKTILVPPSLQNVTRTNDYFVPGEMPSPDPIRLRINHPDDSDIFNHSHPLIAPNAPQLMGAIEREKAQKKQEVALDQAYQQQVSFYNDEIKKFKAKAKLKSGAL